MKKILVLAFFLISMLVNAQTFQWNKDYLTIGNVNSNGYTIFNSSDNAIKIKLYNNNAFSNEYLIRGNSSQAIIYPYIKEFSRNIFSGLTIKTFYDLECYSTDLQTLNVIAQQRINKAQNLNDFKMLVRILGTALKQTSNDEKWQKFGDDLNTGVDYFETYESVKKNGLSQTIIQKIEDKLKGDNLIDKTLDLVVKDKYLNTIGKSLNILYQYGQNTVEIDNSDLQINAYNLSRLVSFNSLFTYTIDFEKTILPAIDPDNDGITNLYDNCPNLFGTSKYNGCTKEYLRDKRKSSREYLRSKDFKHFYIDVNYSYSDLGMLQDDTSYSKRIENFGFYLNLSLPILQHNIGKSKGCFMIDLNGRFGNTNIKDSTINFNNTGDKKLNLFDDLTTYAGISYAFMFNRKSNTAIIISPKIGKIIYSSIKTKNLELQNGNIEKDAFLIDNNKSMYSELQFRVFKKSVSNPTYEGFGFNFGAKYYTSPKITTNPNYSYNWTINNRKFMYPANSIMFYAGISMIF